MFFLINIRLRAILLNDDLSITIDKPILVRLLQLSKKWDEMRLSFEIRQDSRVIFVLTMRCLLLEYDYLKTTLNYILFMMEKNASTSAWTNFVISLHIQVSFARKDHHFLYTYNIVTSSNLNIETHHLTYSICNCINFCRYNEISYVICVSS